MCARPPNPALSETSSQLIAETSSQLIAETCMMDTPSHSSSDSFFVLPPIRAVSFHESSLAGFGQSDALPLGLRSVQSGPVLMNETLRDSPCTGSDGDTSASCSGSCSGSGARSHGGCGSGSAEKGCCSSGGSSNGTNGCTNGTRGCKGGGSCASTREGSGNEAEAEPRLPAAGAAVATESKHNGGHTEGTPTDLPRQPVARVSAKRAVKRKVMESGKSDASKPTFGDLEDLWRTDSEARNYCSFVCSAPAMCRSGQEGVVDATPLPGLVADSSRRKRFKMSSAKTSNPVALLV